MRNYSVIEHHNSNNARRRGLCGWIFNRKTGNREWKTSTTVQVVRDPQGHPLPREPFLVKRSKYVPHIGKKHAAKLAKRAALA